MCIIIRNLRSLSVIILNRCRILWLCMPLVLIGVAVVAWFVLARRDADFVIVGPKTVSSRKTLALLDSTIDAGDFHDCETVQEVVDRLVRGNLGLDVIIDRAAIQEETGVDRDWYQSPVKFEPTPPQPMTVKQFLRLTLHQAELPNVTFVVSTPLIATTRTAAAQEKADYLDRLSTYGYAQMIWAEWTRDIESDDPPFQGR